MTVNTHAPGGPVAGRIRRLLLCAVAAAALVVGPGDALAKTTDSGGLAGWRPASGHPSPVPERVGHARLEQHSRRGGSSGGGSAVPRGGSGGGGGGTVSGGGGGTVSRGGGSTRSSGGSDGGTTRTRSSSGGDPGNTPTYSRPRGDRPATGTAVPRRGNGGGSGIGGGGGYYPGFYPWGWGGLGVGWYGYYDPWGWYDPYGPGVGYGYGYGDDGSLKLKVSPRDAAVFVDGYFAGTVDDYDGLFQRLHLNPGPHRIELRLDGYESLNFEVHIQPDKTITYRGEMQKRDGDAEPEASN